MKIECFLFIYRNKFNLSRENISINLTNCYNLFINSIWAYFFWDKTITRNYKKFDTRTDYGVLYLGFDGEGNEVYNLYEMGYEAGIPQWNIKVYGTETLTGGYKLKRMIIDAGVDPENASYELVPAK